MQKIDAIVVGAGFSGLYMLYRLRELGLTARGYEAGDDVGGVWYWNRYPGAKCDIESVYYNYTFSEELLQEWTWTTRYPDQPAILGYLNHVADRFDLRRDIEFRTRVVSAHYDEGARRWVVLTDRGETLVARYFISGVGCLSSSNTPGFRGLETFEGEQFHTGNWPHQPVDFRGKRVGVIGTGSSGIQAIPEIAVQAEHLYVFQRTPQFSTPAVNRRYEPEYISQIKANYGEVKRAMRESWAGTPRRLPSLSALEDSDEGRQRTYEQAWSAGGWLLSTYKDIVTNAEANETVCEFIREKIHGIVRDPEVASRLAPRHQYGVKRPVLDTNYFETFNRDNVTLVDVKADPIVAITPDGLRTRAQAYGLDTLVFATGYDAMTGALFRIDIRGRQGVTLKDKWGDGAAIRTYLGVATSGFPNFFTITGPESPSVLSNMVVSIEQHVEWISDCIAYMQARDIEVIEPDSQAEAGWSKHCKEVADTTLLPKGESWYTGANIQGKRMSFPIYLAGVGTYRTICDRVAANGYEGFTFQTAAAAAV
ncbi:cyclohexanone monooxygenase [Cupriavidus sp. TKC]|uniref:flavin-containing monooxygenase n=1 Tax=Cupriavidus sp. TKC TaxID=2880159 RepID=UPI0025A69C66|nr:NAD(P)/FAD-dependent oxidoreductase [Cupriavidus sp. TKC]GMG90533.1 cyclohexanone monooxygenase [Cupriavidus sp. TKC]